MYDPVLTTLLAAAEILTTAYWACAIVGFGLVLVSALGGSDADADVDVDFDVDVDVDMDVDLDVDADVDVGADADAGDIASGHAGGAPASHGGGAGAFSLGTWFSVRFIVFFVAVFGILGVVLTRMTEAGRSVTLGISIAGGLVVGQGVHQLFRALKRSSGDTTPTLADYVNKIARVTMPITHSKKGEITLTVRGGLRYIPATAKHADASFAVGDEVAVVEYRGAAARVVSREEFEFLSTTQSGGQT